MSETTNDDLKTLCCTHVIPSGTQLSLYGDWSKNRVLVSIGNSIHKVKKSSLRRVTDGKLGRDAI